MNKVDRMFELLLKVAEIQEKYKESLFCGKNSEEVFDELVITCIDEIDSMIVRLFKHNRMSNEVNESIEKLTQILAEMEEIKE